MYRTDDSILDIDQAVDVDEDSPPLIRGYCTPVDVDEETPLSVGYQKTSKPVAVDSAIVNTVWDTIIEEEEEEDFEEVSRLSCFLFFTPQHFSFRVTCIGKLIMFYNGFLGVR